MTPSFEALQQALKSLPGVGMRAAERMAMHLLVESPESMPVLQEAMQEAADKVGRCPICGNIAEEGELCAVCADPSRDRTRLCIVERVPDLAAMERAGVYRGVYLVLHGKLSPLQGVTEDDLNLACLEKLLKDYDFAEVILALSNDIEGEATCHFIQETYLNKAELQPTVTRIGFGLPSGGNLLYADAVTLKSALEGRREYD